MVASGTSAGKPTGNLAIQGYLMALQTEYGADFFDCGKQPLFTGFVCRHSSLIELDQAHQFREPGASHVSL
jgi:hypothetical protein